MYGRKISEFNFIPRTVKIDKFQYYFSSRNEFIKTKKTFSKILTGEFLFELNTEMINKINLLYGVPLNNGYRNAKFSAFFSIPIYDIISLLVFFKFFKKMLEIFSKPK